MTIQQVHTGAAEAAYSDHASRVEQALLQAGALIDSTVSFHRRRPPNSVPVDRADGTSTGEVLGPLVSGARYTVSVMLTEPGEFTDTVMRMLATVPAQVTVRVLCTAELADSLPLVSVGGLRIRGAVRVSRSELRAIVVDGTAALVRAAEGRSLVVHDAATVRALELFFATAWTRGRGLGDRLQLSPRLRTELVRQILERLRAGCTDETAARELNVSLRTYRRYVAEIMRELNAHSRFEAGYRAVESGLLSK
ncbi:response regulator transcription factor [Streptomyces sp. NPDC058045]|uniref:response regulator transcription factor n=1 Tax=Streptomyces sp. NPDC058045 TaxID=3346311 RepID=UPI0036E8857F